MYPSLRVQNKIPTADIAYWCILWVRRPLILGCVKSNLWEHEHTWLWIIEQIFWNKTAFALSNIVCQMRCWPVMGVKVWKWIGDSAVSLEGLSVQQSFSRFDFSWMYVGSLDWLQAWFMNAGRCPVANHDIGLMILKHLFWRIPRTHTKG